jgi:hypothetical protein
MSSLYNDYCANVYRMWKNPRTRKKHNSTATAAVIFTRDIYKYELWIGCFRDWQHGAVFVNGFNIGRYFQVRFLNVYLSYLQKYIHNFDFQAYFHYVDITNSASLSLQKCKPLFL